MTNQQCLTICWAFMIISMMGIGDACQGFSMTTSNCHLVPSEYSNNQSAARAAISDLPHRGIFTPRCQVRIQVILLISVSIFSNVACFFLAATKQLYEWFSSSVCLFVCLSICLSHLFDYVPIIASSQNLQKLLPMTEVVSMQKVKVIGQMWRSQRS